MTVFLHERAKGTVAHNPSTDEDNGRHWIWNRHRHGYIFDFVVHDREGTLGFEIYGKDLDWIGRFIYNREIDYVEEPCEPVQNVVEECVEIREDLGDSVEMRKRCPNCDSTCSLDCAPELELMIEGTTEQRIFEAACPSCGEDMVKKEML